MAVKKQVAKVLKDEDFITIDGKSYGVNQGSPSVTVMKKSLTLIDFQKKYAGAIKVIEILNNGKDDLLIKGYSDNFLTDLEKIDNQIEKQSQSLEKLLDDANSLFQEVLIFYLGEQLDLSNIGFLDLIALANELNGKNKHIKKATK